MTIQDALDLFAYWREVPPVGVTMLAAFGGGRRGGSRGSPDERLVSKPNPGKSPEELEQDRRNSEFQLRQMAAMMNGSR